jgi:hypothetical protein
VIGAKVNNNPKIVPIIDNQNPNIIESIPKYVSFSLFIISDIIFNIVF